jgi:hypothetical protein
MPLLQIIKELLRRGVAQDAIGIITPYNAQVNIIQQYTDCLVEVHTIDKYQVDNYFQSFIMLNFCCWLAYSGSDILC